ncbi:MAG: hypothetical protein QT08_C0019G0025 [archaeon GW2011_AR17]|nr:MAG: hypothetical protein QT08_C0019G0025 [archaeon GW2011_AR17]MBS3154727.1 hypothetical protein [Candidatus Woesearchaeota archaeon]HIH58430.1 hypothetical protein [Nanoarchaeota archaeon]HII13720.1 hypothetical protein [Nanoarchaeota archaeon]
MAPQLRIEIYIPYYYNPEPNTDPTSLETRKPIEVRKHRLIKNEIVEKFKAVSKHPANIEGVWENPQNGNRHYDLCYKLEVTINGHDSLEEDLLKWKEKLKTMFEQFEIYMVYYPINRV